MLKARRAVRDIGMLCMEASAVGLGDVARSYVYEGA
jgi:hypothetical protein